MYKGNSLFHVAGAHHYQTINAHFCDQNVAPVWRKNGASKTIAAFAIAVHARGKIGSQFPINKNMLCIFKIHYILSFNVNNSHGIVAPMGYDYNFIIGRTSNHFGQRTTRHNTHYFIFFRVNYSYSRWTRCCWVEIASIIDYPKIFALCDKQLSTGLPRK